MKDTVKLKQGKLDMLCLLLKDPKIRSCIEVDGSYAKEIIVQDNGDILLGRSKHGWINRLFNSYKEIDFFSTASKIAVVITGGVHETNSEMDGLIKEIVNKTLVNDNREQIIDLLFQYVVLFCKDSIYYSEYIRGKPKIKDLSGTVIGTVGVDLGGAYIGQIPLVLDRKE